MRTMPSKIDNHRRRVSHDLVPKPAPPPLPPVAWCLWSCSGCCSVDSRDTGKHPMNSRDRPWLCRKCLAGAVSNKKTLNENQKPKWPRNVTITPLGCQGSAGSDVESSRARNLQASGRCARSHRNKSPVHVETQCSHLLDSPITLARALDQTAFSNVLTGFRTTGRTASWTGRMGEWMDGAMGGMEGWREG